MEKQYLDIFGKPMTKKKYDALQRRKQKNKRERDRKEKERLSRKFHDDGPNLIQGITDHLDRSEKRATGEGTSRIFKYKKDPYAGKVQEPPITNKKYSQPRSSNYDEMSMGELMKRYNKAKEKQKKRKATEKRLYGRPIKKGEVGI
tara:strand:+ start:59 stop:496 length:438 start_codon:yes stop_codon:yes gene_type:complete